MAQEAACSLSISDLLRMLNEKLGLETSKLRGISLPLMCLTSSLESEIDGLEAGARGVLRLISSLRNILRPVNNLPPEILSHIARYLTGNRGDATEVVPLTHVCRYWRESIISTPENWTLISGKNDYMTAVCLERAKAAPLKITLEMPLSSSFPDIFAPYLQSTRTLVVYGLPAIEELIGVFPNFPRSMPTLRSLELERAWDAHWEETIDPFESFVPALERLLFTGIPLFPSLFDLGTLTELTIRDSLFEFPLDTLLDFLEGNHSLKWATLGIHFVDPSLLISQRKTAMRNQLRCLSINCLDTRDAQALISSIPLWKGADLCVHLGTEHATLSDFLPDVSTAHISNPPSPTSFELTHAPWSKHIILSGPDGKLSFSGLSEVAFADFAVLPLANVREVRLCYWKETTANSFKPPVFCPSYFPTLETLTVGCTDVLGTLSALLSNSSPSPSLKTIGFLNCDLSEHFMEELTKFASERQNIPTSTWLHRVQIVRSDGVFPSVASIRRLRKYVKVVEARIEDKFSTDLT